MHATNPNDTGSQLLRMERRMRHLALATVVGWSFVALLLLTGFRSSDRSPERFRALEIDAERINIVDADGQQRLVFAAPHRIPGVTIEGKEYPASWDGRNQQAGAIFFNREGDEVGGLIFDGFARDSGYWAGGHFSFDQYKQNQVVALQYVDNGRSRRAGLRVWDRPTDRTMGEFFKLGLARSEATDPAVRDSLRAEQQALRDAGALGVERMFVGSRDETAQIILRDREGRERARLLVDESGDARLEFLDAAGVVTAAFPK